MLLTANAASLFYHYVRDATVAGLEFHDTRIRHELQLMLWLGEALFGKLVPWADPILVCNHTAARHEDLSYFVRELEGE